MPALRSDSNKPVHVKVKKPKPKAGPPTPSRVSRPAPKTQPGPSSDAEQRKIVRHKKKPTYGKALQRARVKGPATARGTKRPAGDTKSDAEFAKGRKFVRGQYKRAFRDNPKDFAKFYKPGTTVDPKTLGAAEYGKSVEKAQKRRADMSAPVLKALEQTTRGLHAVSSAERAAIKGVKEHGKISLKDVGKAAVKGVKNEDKSTASDVLKDLGVKNKAALAVGGFAGDVVGDPTTYITFGAGTIARKTAEAAAKKTEKKALKAGLTKDQAKRMGDRAAKQSGKTADQSRGVTVRLGGREVPGVRKATAKTAKVVKRATNKPAVLRKVKDKARHVVADINPNIVPDNISRADYASVREATRTARSSTARDVSKAKTRAAGLRKALGKADQEILDAIESRSLRKLTPEKRRVAKQLQDEFKYARRMERRAGIGVKDRKGYVPHALKEPLEKGEGIQSPGSKTISPGFAKGRKEQRTLAQIRVTDPGKYSEDAALLFANRKIESAIASNKAKLNRRLLDLGQRVRKGDTHQLGEGEKVFRVVGSNIDEVEGKAEMDQFLRTGDGGKGGQYVILNEQVVNRAIQNVIPSAERSTIGKALDRGQGGWKWLATVPNPGFHVRNLLGDAQNAYLGENAGRLAVNTAKAGKVLKRVGKQEEALRTLKGTVDGPSPTIKIRGAKVDVDQIIRDLEAKGGMRSGYINRELSDQLAMTSGTKGGVKKIRRSAGRASRGVARTVQNREDLFRVATVLGGLERGLSMEKAVARASKYHFDYADLTRIERQYLRRVMPFYTFSARNIPLQLKSYFQKPGKFANYQKIREETAKAFGLDLDEVEGSMEEYEQRGAPLAVKWRGKEFTVGFGPSGLPLADLNEMPASANPKEWADEWMSRGMSLVTPALKTPVELWANVSFFFRDDIERETGPLVPAPSFVARFPAKLKKELGIVPDYVDRRSGKKQWGWPAKVDYVSHILPGPVNYLNRVLTPSERKQSTTGLKTAAYLGVRATPVDKTSATINRLYDERAKVGKQRSSLNQRGMTKEHPSSEWRKVNDRYNELDREIARLRVERGDKLVPRRGRPKIKAPEFVGAGGGVEWVDGDSSVQWVP